MFQVPILIFAFLSLRFAAVYRKAISPPARCLWCRKAWPPQKTRKTCRFLLAFAVRFFWILPALGFGGFMRGDYAYAVYYYCAKDGCRHSLAVFGVLGRAHDDVVAAGEHAADGAEDYDGEDGDDDAAWWCLVLVVVRAG
jgi:hypothetical protein